MKTAIVFVMLLASIVYSFGEKRYVIKKITDEGSNYFAINSKGEVAYVGVDLQGREQVYLYSFGITYQLTENLAYSYDYFSIDINDKSQVVWAMRSDENSSKTKYVIMVHDANTRKLVDDLYFHWNFELNVKINNSGVVVWHGWPYYGAYSQAYKYEDSKLRNLAGSYNNPNMYPVINDNGLIAWYGDNRYQNEWNYRVRYTSPGDTVVKVIPQGTNEGSMLPQVDNLNNIVFTRSVSSIYSLYRYNGTTTTKIADSIYQYHYTVNNGNIAYTKGVQNNYSVCRFMAGGTSILASGGDYFHPAINGSGVTVWRNSANEIFVWREGTGMKKIGTDCHKPPLINDDGTIVFAGYDWDYYGSAIYMAEYKEVWDITGKVVLSSGAGLEGVSVKSDSNVLATTDASGNFTCTNLDPKTYTLTFLKAGYVFTPASVTVGLGGHYTIPGNIVATPSTDISVTEIENIVQVYPNPASQVLYIKAGIPGEKVGRVSIYDTEGRKVIAKVEQTNSTEIITDISHLKPGQYYCLIMIGTREIKKTFMIAR